jgi:hypothetical protein
VSKFDHQILGEAILCHILNLRKNKEGTSFTYIGNKNTVAKGTREI